MFRPGKVLKVKVELSPDVVGFGRATIVESEGKRLFLHLKTAKGEKRTLPKGTRVWFVSDAADNPFDGLWSTTIVSSRLIGGKTALECARPKFEAEMQKRKHKRISVNCAVKLHGEQFEKLYATTRNLSRSGVGIETAEDCSDIFPIGHHVDIVIETKLGPVATTVRVIQARYNWLANRTDVGFEFVKIDQAATELVEKLLQSLGAQARLAPDGKDGVIGPQGQLSGWLKSTKDNVSFVKNADLQAMSALSEDDLDELDADDEADMDDEI